MKVEYVNPFVNSVKDLFSTMLKCDVKRGDLSLKREPGRPNEMLALIGLSGGDVQVRGTVALSLPVQTAVAMSNRLLGTQATEASEAVADSVAEMLNIMAGGAKAKLPHADRNPIQLSLPTVLRDHGSGFSVQHPRDTAWLEIPFTSDLGPFSLRVTLEFNCAQK